MSFILRGSCGSRGGRQGAHTVESVNEMRDVMRSFLNGKTSLGVTGGRETKGDGESLYVVVLSSCVLPLKSDVVPF